MSKTEARRRGTGDRAPCRLSPGGSREMQMAIVEVSITPLGTAEPGVSRYVAGCLRVLRKSGLTYQLTPMGTVI